MKIKLLIVIIIQYIFLLDASAQSSRGYIDHAVPAFDNETKKLDWSKVEVNPIKLYVPEKILDNSGNKNGGGNTTYAVADNTDVQVFPSGTAQSEQHMTVSKVNPLNIILCSNTTQYEGYYVSQDGGATWFGSNGMPDAVQTYGDPSTSVDGSGNIFIQAMTPGSGGSGVKGYKVFKSANKGTSWGLPVFSNATPATASFDKQMMCIDNLPGSPFSGNIYSAWSDFSTPPYVVKFNRSTDGGASYLTNIILRNNWGQGTNVQTGVNGEVYVCWANYGTANYPANGIGFTRSTNGGLSFTDLTPVFGYNGIRVGGTNPIYNNTRVNDFPSMAVDKSCGTNRGRIYIAYPGHQGGVTANKAVIYVRHSDNQGANWSAETEVSISTGRQNWFPWITVDDATGTVSVAYLTFDGASGFTTNTYLAYSFNGGSTWSNIKVSDVGHTVAAIAGFATGYCGDYIANTAYGNKNYIAWNDNRTGTWQNYVSRVDFDKPVLFSANADLNINGPVNHTLPTASDISYQSTANINTPIASAFITNSGTNVEMTAQGHIILKPGFNAKSGSHFDAAIASITSCVNTLNLDGVTDAINDYAKELTPAYTGDATQQFSCYPNPASAEINFGYLVVNNSKVSLMIYDMQGRLVENLIDNIMHAPGYTKASYNVANLPHGVYTYRLMTNDYTKTGKFTKLN